ARPPPTASLFPRPPAPAVYSLSLHAALPIYGHAAALHFPQLLGHLAVLPLEGQHDVGLVEIVGDPHRGAGFRDGPLQPVAADGRSEEHTLNSSHVKSSYAVFCLNKKKKHKVD